MRSSAGQVQWIPMEEIVEREAQSAPGDVVVVRARPEGGYRLVAGGERLEEMRRAGQACVDAVLDFDGQMEKQLDQLLDALVRGSIHYLDEAKAYAQLLSTGVWNERRLAQRIGRTPQTISRKLRLMTLGPEAEAEIRQGGMCESQVQEVLRLPGRQARLKVLKQIREGGLSMKETEKLVDGVLARMPVPVTGTGRMKPLMRDYRLYLNAIRGIVEQMQDAGLEAGMSVKVGKHVAAVRITVPTFARRSDAAR